MGEGVVVADAQGRLQVFNPMARHLLGAETEDAPSDEWSSHFGLLLPDAITPFPKDEEPLVRALRGESCDNVEMAVRQGNAAAPRWINVTGRPISDNVGRFHGGVIVLHDITEQRAPRRH